MPPSEAKRKRARGRGDQLEQVGTASNSLTSDAVDGAANDELDSTDNQPNDLPELICLAQPDQFERQTDKMAKIRTDRALLGVNLSPVAR